MNNDVTREEQERRDAWSAANGCEWSAEREERLNKLKEAEAQRAEIDRLLYEARKLMIAAYKPSYNIFGSSTAVAKRKNKAESLDNLLKLHKEAGGYYRTVGAHISYWKDLDAKAREEAEKKEREKKAEEARRLAQEKETALKTQAVQYLIEHGFKLGEDFHVDNAVFIANNHASNAEIARMTATGGYAYFNGQNCEGPCSGWDMKDRRCDCGNRRVCWVTSDDHSFLRPHVYAEAY